MGKESVDAAWARLNGGGRGSNARFDRVWSAVKTGTLGAEAAAANAAELYVHLMAVPAAVAAGATAADAPPAASGALVVASALSQGDFSAAVQRDVFALRSEAAATRRGALERLVNYAQVR